MNMKVDLDTLLKQAQDMQSKMQLAQAELAQIVKIEMDGRHNVKSIQLDPPLLKEPKEFMEELLVAAFNDALQKIEKESRQKLNDLTHHMQTKFSSDVTSA